MIMDMKTRPTESLVYMKSLKNMKFPMMSLTYNRIFWFRAPKNMEKIAFIKLNDFIIFFFNLLYSTYIKIDKKYLIDI